MKFTRRTLQSAAALTLLGALAATPAFAQDKPKVALVMKSLANEFFRTMEDGAKAHQKAQRRAVHAGGQRHQGRDRHRAQIKMVEQMIAQKINALVIAPADSKALVPVIKKPPSTRASSWSTSTTSSTPPR
jgi:ribose transport system substrate-binding protein